MVVRLTEDKNGAGPIDLSADLVLRPTYGVRRMCFLDTFDGAPKFRDGFCVSGFLA